MTEEQNAIQQQQDNSLLSFGDAPTEDNLKELSLQQQIDIEERKNQEKTDFAAHRRIYPNSFNGARFVWDTPQTGKQPDQDFAEFDVSRKTVESSDLIGLVGIFVNVSAGWIYWGDEEDPDYDEESKAPICKTKAVYTRYGEEEELTVDEMPLTDLIRQPHQSKSKPGQFTRDMKRKRNFMHVYGSRSPVEKPLFDYLCTLERNDDGTVTASFGDLANQMEVSQKGIATMLEWGQRRGYFPNYDAGEEKVTVTLGDPQSFKFDEVPVTKENVDARYRKCEECVFFHQHFSGDLDKEGNMRRKSTKCGFNGEFKFVVFALAVWDEQEEQTVLYRPEDYAEENDIETLSGPFTVRCLINKTTGLNVIGEGEMDVQINSDTNPLYDNFCTAFSSYYKTMRETTPRIQSFEGQAVYNFLTLVTPVEVRKKDPNQGSASHIPVFRHLAYGRYDDCLVRHNVAKLAYDIEQTEIRAYNGEVVQMPNQNPVFDALKAEGWNCYEPGEETENGSAGSKPDNDGEDAVEAKAVPANKQGKTPFVQKSRN